jgi:hypothetical protein
LYDEGQEMQRQDLTMELKRIKGPLVIGDDESNPSHISHHLPKDPPIKDVPFDHPDMPVCIYCKKPYQPLFMKRVTAPVPIEGTDPSVGAVEDRSMEVFFHQECVKKRIVDNLPFTPVNRRERREKAKVEAKGQKWERRLPR